MKYTILTTTLIIAFQIAYSQHDTVLFLPDIQIGDQRISMPFSEANRTINILTREDIQKLPVQSLNEVLSYLPGVDIRNRGIKGAQADISVRGSSFEQVLVMLNGIKINDPQTGHHSLNVPVPLESIERIEVLKGPGARRYGQNALAAAINIITKVADTPQSTQALEIGEFGTVQGDLGVSLHHGNAFKQMLNVSHLRSDGYRYNTDVGISNAFYQNNWKVNNGQFSTMAGFSKRKFGANGFYASPDYKDQYEDVETSIVSLAYKWFGDKWHIKPSVYWRRNQDEYLLIRHQPEVYRNLHFGNTLGAEIQSGYESSLGTTGFGLEYRKVYLKSNNLGQRDRNEVAFYAEHRFSLIGNKLTITPGFNINYFQSFGSFFYPGIDMGYSINDKWSVYANVGNTYRVPTYTDLYYIGPSNIGNENLVPERAMTYEAGVKYFGSQWYFNVAYYRRDSRNLIDWVKDRENDPWMPQNFYKAYFNGLEIENKWTLANHPAGINRIEVNYNYINAGLNEDYSGALSRYALDNLKHQLIGRLTGNIVDNLSYTIGGRFIDRVNLDDYFLMDLQAKYAFDKFSIYAQANNVLNTQYTETSLVPMPGRWFTIGFKNRIDF
ncbi:TonB-dependent receptor [Membranihabitans maritimus]|uniref:TonB-dependent receptor n=1 Tax=Membranihabitans maritimus TaxID=2904244 RepID=UPI0034E2B9DD